MQQKVIEITGKEKQYSKAHITTAYIMITDKNMYTIEKHKPIFSLTNICKGEIAYICAHLREAYSISTNLNMCSSSQPHISREAYSISTNLMNFDHLKS